MLVYRSVTHFLCQKMQFWKKNMSSGMQSPTSSKLHQKKTLPAIFADGFDGLKHGKKWRRDWDEQFKPCSIFQGPFPPSHSIFVRDTCPPLNKQHLEPETLFHLWKILGRCLFSGSSSISNSSCVLFLHVFSNATLIRKLNDGGTKLGFLSLITDWTESFQ